jgi:hypothetical protein
VNKANPSARDVGCASLQLITLSGLLFAFAGAGTAGAGSAPPALYNRTVVLSWTENRSQKADSGEIKHSTTASDFRIYVSSAGRLFSRFTRQNLRSGRSNSSEMAPDGNTSFTGIGQGDRTTRFEGRRLVSENRMKSGARRIQAEFDSEYRSCALKVLYGKEGGAPLYHRAMDGRMYYILSTEIIAPTCSIEPGNLVARE